MWNLDHRYIKGKDEIIFGLHEAHHPPTLIYPRPKGIHSDDDMDRMLINLEPESIYNLLYK